VGIIDFILDIAALLLWLNWRGVTLDPLAKATPATLVGTLRRAEPSRVRHWHFLAALIGLIFLRAVLYRSLGPALHWTGQLDLVATRLSFPSDLFQWMLAFSALGFALTLLIFYVSLLLVSLLSVNGVADLTLPRLARAHLGPVDVLPKWFQLALPFLIGTFIYWALTWPLANWELLPRPVSEGTRLAQSALVGLGSYIAWKYLLVALLTLHLLNNHIYFGAHPLWNYVTLTARRLLVPLRVLPLRFGKIDFAPLVGIALVLLIAQIAERGLTLFAGYRILGLPEIYRGLSR
jgi:uncharacterized protein YggT (Ycf19 family)